MEQYISKSALVAEIDRLREVQPLDAFQPKEQNKIDWLAGKLFTITILETFIDTLEVKEMDSMQEEPVSIWHDASEEPNDKSSCLIHYIVGGKVSYRDIFPVIYNKEVREFVSESYPHPTGYKVKQSSLEGGVVAEVYKDMRDRFPLSDIYKWAYVDDILNLSNVERAVKDRKEKPVSEELETEIEKYFNALYHNWTKKDREKDADVEEMCRQTARHFAEWQKEYMLKDAIETSVMAAFAIGLHIEVKLDPNKYSFGDKVKLVIIKENNK